MMIGVQPPSAEDRRFLQQQDEGVWESKGMGVTVPERKFVLATTAGKVRAFLLRSCGSHAMRAHVFCNTGTTGVLTQPMLCSMFPYHNSYHAHGLKS